ncbi:hypothetical protein [Treponema succinifaciens]|uniref:hypothetical protein n=1 Tax=Treponema succinifaciens TaxID=167 RepID=UPI003F804245
MGEETTTITRSKAITLINDSIENFFTHYDSYCCENRDAISEDEKKLHEELCDVIYILRNDDDYKNDLKIMSLEHLTQFLYMCKEMVENNDLLAKTFYPKGDIVIVEDCNTNPELIEKSLKILEQHGDAQIKSAIKDYHNGERKILFSKMPETQNGRTECKNESYVNYLSEELNHDSPENKVRIAVTLAHEFRRNANSNTLTGETRGIILEDTKIIESFANAYGEGIYKKFPEYGILHYIKKIFGETELKEFADYAFDSTGSYWKVNEAGDLIDDGKISRVADSKGSELYSGTKGLQGTLQEWLGMENAYAALMQPAGFEWDGKQWSKNPGKIDYSVIEKAHNDGHLTDDQYNLIQLAAGKSASDDKSEKINLFKQFFSDYKQANIIKTQVQVDIANRAWEWLQIQRKKIFGKNVKYSNDVVKAPETNQGTICLKQQPLEKKYGYPYTAPFFGSLCLATSIINLYILNEGLTEENVENFMNDAKGKFIASDGNVISFEKMSKKLSELSGTSQYFDYIYYNPETKTYSVNKKAMTKDDFIKSDYDYGIGAYIHLYDDPEDPDINIAHYELIKRNPFIEYNPGISDYKLYEIYPVKKYNRG